MTSLSDLIGGAICLDFWSEIDDDAIVSLLLEVESVMDFDLATAPNNRLDLELDRE